MAVGGVHDMGGVRGYGAVEPEENEPVFHDEWEGRVFGLVVSIRGRLQAQQPGESRSASSTWPATTRG